MPFSLSSCGFCVSGFNDTPAFFNDVILVRPKPTVSQPSAIGGMGSQGSEMVFYRWYLTMGLMSG